MKVDYIAQNNNTFWDKKNIRFKMYENHSL